MVTVVVIVHQARDTFINLPQCPPVLEPPARRKRLSAVCPAHSTQPAAVSSGHSKGGRSTDSHAHHPAHGHTPMPPPASKKARWPYYKRGKSIADDPTGLQKALNTSPNHGAFGPTGAGASTMASCRSDGSSSSSSGSDASSHCCSSPPKPRAASPLGIAGKEKQTRHNPLEIWSPMLSAEAAAEQKRRRREQVEEYEEMEALLEEQEARLGAQEGTDGNTLSDRVVAGRCCSHTIGSVFNNAEVLARHYHERAVKLVGYLLDDMFERGAWMYRK